ncbi:MAG: Holliday junction resolvase Hjc [Candidatus Woesearchaeota archaeon]
MSLKSKGSNAERDLIHKFHANSWRAIRSAGSGSMQYPSPDVLASNGKRILAIECKTSKNNSKYIDKTQIEDLKIFASDFKAEPWIGIRFARTDWYFLKLEELEITAKNAVITKQLAEVKGRTLTQLLQL